ncbi:MAG: hypothetical protein K2Y37_23545 [Pirellulales bacterium]|nr:hypothetical protein [Pirellulales bacterium]
MSTHSTAGCRWLRGVLGALVVSIFTSAAWADAIVYDNGPPLYSPLADQAAWVADSQGADSIEAADDFSLPSGNNRVYSMHWWGIYESGIAVPPSDAFTIKIYNDNTAIKGAPAPAPNTVNTNVNIISLARTATGTFIEGLPVYEYDARVRGFSEIPPYLSLLGGNFRYWLGISNNSAGNDWAWVQSANSAGAMYLKSATTQQWVATDKSMAFYFTVVPEPSGLAMAALAAVGAAVTAARRRGRRNR